MEKHICCNGNIYYDKNGEVGIWVNFLMAETYNRYYGNTFKMT